AHMARLESKIARLSVAAVAPDAEGLEIELDGSPLERGAWGTPRPLQPGAHVIAARAARQKPWSTTVSIPMGESRTVVVPSLDRADEAAPAARAGAGGSQRVVGYVVGGAGVGALAVGAVFGLKAFSSWKDRN